MATRDETDQAAYWDVKYEGEPPWDAGAPAPPLCEVLLRTDLVPPGRQVAVPGCGRGHDAIRWAEAGHQVLGFDFAPGAVAQARALARQRGVADRCGFEQRDLFTLGTAYPGRFDVVVEYTCFCAIHPSRRTEYADVVAACLKDRGLLVGLFYPNREGDDGPPFPVRREHLQRVFVDSGRFELVSEQVPASSIERRLGLEQLVVLRKC